MEKEKSPLTIASVALMIMSVISVIFYVISGYIGLILIAVLLGIYSITTAILSQRE